MAESFGVDAERYNRTRMPYPDALVRRIAAASPGPDVLDVGSGTGIAARQFQAAGCTVLGVEPDERMAAFARRAGTQIEVATFEDWDPAGRRFNAVVAGTSWHWVDPVAGAAKAGQVLRPAGRLAAIWHVFELPPAVREAGVAATARALPDMPFRLPLSNIDAYLALAAKAAAGISETGVFGEPEQWRYDWERDSTRAQWLDQMPTFGTLTRVPPDKLAEVLAATGAAIDALGGSMTVRYVTLALVAQRTAR